MPIFFRRSTTMSQEIVGPLTITSALGVQGGSLELGATLDVAPETPYLDFHFGLGAAQDYNVRLLNAADNRLDVVTALGGTVLSVQGDKIGIGTLSPAAKLVVSELAGGAELRVDGLNGTVGLSLGADATQPWVGTRTNHALRLLTNNTEQVRVQADGHVGIGTTNPDHVLVVGPPSGGRHLVVNDIPTARWGFATGNFNLAIQNDGSGTWETRLVITKIGHVGIGTTHDQTTRALTIQASDAAISLQDRNVPTGNHWEIQASAFHPDTFGIVRYDAHQGAQASQSLVITNGGNVGIGTPGPEAKLEVRGDDSGHAASFSINNPTLPVRVTTPMTNLRLTPPFVIRFDDGANGAYIAGPNYNGTVRGFGVTGAQALEFGGWTSETGYSAWVVLQNGNVGIGTVGPTTQLEVVGDTGLRVTRASNADQHLTLTGGNGSGVATVQATYALNLNANDAAHPLTFQIAGAEKMRIHHDGTVGIGTTTPQFGRLMIEDSAVPLSLRETGRAVDQGGLWRIPLDEGVLRFDVNTGAPGSEFDNNYRTPLAMTKDGTVGIGTTTPNTQLEVVGDTGFRVTRASNVDQHLTLTGGNGSGVATVQATYQLNLNANDASFPLTFQIASSEKMRIHHDGNVGIGTTTPGATVHINAPNQIGLKVDGPRSGVGSGLQLTTTGTGGRGWEILATGVTSAQGVDKLNIRNLASASDNLTITSTGYVGIGTTNPDHILHVKAPDAVGRFESSTNQAFLRFSTTEGFDNRVEIANRPGGRLTLWVGGAGDAFSITRDGKVGIVPRNPAEGFTLDVSGAAHASGFPTSSDARFKTNVMLLTNVLEKLEKIHGVSFEWNEAYASLGRSTGRREIGVIAQEVEAVFPALITTWGEEGYKSIDYGRLTGVLVEAIKELKAANATLQQRVAALERAMGERAKKEKSRFPRI
jgi:hypothetical protein